MPEASALREQCFPFNANCTNRIPNVSFGIISGEGMIFRGTWGWSSFAKIVIHFGWLGP